jgi:hypothetical protein
MRERDHNEVGRAGRVQGRRVQGGWCRGAGELVGGRDWRLGRRRLGRRRLGRRARTTHSEQRARAETGRWRRTVSTMKNMTGSERTI